MAQARVLLIDNYDSFTWNLVQAFGALGADVRVHRNDEIDIAGAKALAPTHLVISPGPGAPADAGVSQEMISAFAGAVPILGVCLGHQAIVEAFGGAVVRADAPIHGKASRVSHDGAGVYTGVAQEFEAGRYHSLTADPERMPDVLTVSARAGPIIMGVRHRTLAIEGVQFHPESILTAAGPQLLANFLAVAQSSRGTSVLRSTRSR